jgi:hypothetical protein
MRQRLIALLFLVLIDISISSEVQKNNEKKLINSDVLNKKLLPDVKHLMKDNIAGNRQKFLHLLNDLEADGYKFVNGKYFTINKLCDIHWNFCLLEIPDRESLFYSFYVPYAFHLQCSVSDTFRCH